MKIHLHDRTFECQINRSRRKNVRIQMMSPSRLLITAPPRMSLAELERLVISKSSWLLRQAAKLEEISFTPLNSVIENGAQVLYLGKPYALLFQPKTSPAVRCSSHQLILSAPSLQQTEAEELLRNWYICTAKAHFQDKTAIWASRMGVSPQKITIKDQKTRWGSCSSRGNISFNWRIIMAPPEVIDYLVVHELSHMRVPNHSAKFWQLVESQLPEYRVSRKWLKDHGRLLSRILQASLKAPASDAQYTAAKAAQYCPLF